MRYVVTQQIVKNTVKTIHKSHSKVPVYVQEPNLNAFHAQNEISKENKGGKTID